MKRIYDFPYPIIGVTGGIAVGKSTVLSLLKKTNAVIIADDLVKDIYSWPETLSFFKEKYPQFLFDSSVDLKSLRKEFFTEPVIFRNVAQFIQERIPLAFYKKVILDNLEGRTLFYEVPLLFELNLEERFDEVICVYVPREEQLKRLIKRDNISLDLAESMLKAQMDIEIKKERAHRVIDNTGSLSDLTEQIEKMSSFFRSINAYKF